MKVEAERLRQVDPVALARRLYEVYRANLPAQVIGQVAEELSYWAEEEQREELG